MTLNFPGILPISTNQLRRTNFQCKTVHKSVKYSAFENTIAIECLGKLQEIREFEAGYDEKEEYLECSVMVSMPNLITKKDKHISSQSLDLDNCLKGLLDSVFKTFRFLDDRMICRLLVEKGIGEKGVVVTLERLKMRSERPIHGIDTPRS